MLDAAVADLDLGFFRRSYLPAAVAPGILEANERTEIDQLRSLRFLTTDALPTALGLLVLGRDVRRFLPGAYVQFVRYDDTARTLARNGPVVLTRIDPRGVSLFA